MDYAFHTFKALNESPNSNYLCFYNELTGVIKVFYYIKMLREITDFSGESALPMG